MNHEDDTLMHAAEKLGLWLPELTRMSRSPCRKSQRRSTSLANAYKPIPRPIDRGRRCHARDPGGSKRDASSSKPVTSAFRQR